MTLIELIVSILILAFLGGAILWMLVTVKRIYQASTMRGAARQRIQVIVWNMQEDLKDSNFGTLTATAAGASPAAFSVLSAFDANNAFKTDTTGAPVWQKYIIYYVPAGTTRLYRREVYGTFTSALTLTQLLTYCNGQGKMLSDSVSSLSLVSNSSSRNATLSLTLQGRNNHGKTDVQSRQVTLLFNN
jgi:type II secretory pathway component PulJ